MKSSEVWLRDYEIAKQLADDTLAMIQVSVQVTLLPSFTPFVSCSVGSCHFSLYAHFHAQCPALYPAVTGLIFGK